MGRIKRLLTLVLSVAIVLAMNASVFGAEINVNERKILDAFEKEPFASNLDKKYINQFENKIEYDQKTIDRLNEEISINKTKIEYIKKQKYDK